MIDENKLREVVAGYLEHCRTRDDRFKDASMSITMMTFVSCVEDQWQMILEAVRQARDDDELRHVAAGPIEGLLGRHGEEVIGKVEQQAAQDPRFARALTGVWQYMMTDSIWERVQALRSLVAQPLKAPPNLPTADPASCPHVEIFVEWDRSGGAIRLLLSPKKKRVLHSPQKMTLRHPKCAGCGKRLSEEELGSRLVPGGDLFDEHYCWEWTQA